MKTKAKRTAVPQARRRAKTKTRAGLKRTEALIATMHPPLKIALAETRELRAQPHLSIAYVNLEQNLDEPSEVSLEFHHGTELELVGTTDERCYFEVRDSNVLEHFGYAFLDLARRARALGYLTNVKDSPALASPAKPLMRFGPDENRAYVEGLLSSCRANPDRIRALREYVAELDSPKPDAGTS